MYGRAAEGLEIIDNDSMGASIGFLPMMRAKLTRAHEEKFERSETKVTDREFLSYLPTSFEGYTSGLKAAFELCSPMDKAREGAKWNEQWHKRRHLLRREGEHQQNGEHPFRVEHNKKPDELYEMLPTEIKNFVEGLEFLKEMTSVRAKFTMAVKTYAEWKDYDAERARRVAQVKYEHEKEYATEYGTEWVKKMKDADKAVKVA